MSAWAVVAHWIDSGVSVAGPFVSADEASAWASWVFADWDACTSYDVTLLQPPSDADIRAASARHEGLCVCGKPVEHLDADEDSAEWACRVPAASR